MKNKVSIGEKYGNLLVISENPEKKWGKKAWRCQCDCGSPTIQIRTTSSLTAGKKTHCGCNNPKIINLKHERFGFLSVIDGPFKNDSGRITWKTRCICGNVKNTLSKVLQRGEAISCGCQGSYKAIEDWASVPKAMLPFIAHDSPERKLNVKYGPYICRICDQISLFYSANSDCFQCRQIRNERQRKDKLERLRSKDHLHLIISLEQAREKGLKRYFDAIACPNGHIADRFTSNQGCTVCSYERAKAIPKDVRRTYEKKSRSRPDYKAKRNKQLTEKRKNDSTFLVMERCRNRINGIFRKQKIPKKGISLELLGCEEWETLRQWIEEKFYNHPVTGESMTWDNREKWEIDHILPLGFLSVDISLENQKLLCNYRNLRPLWIEDHRVKSFEDNKRIQSLKDKKINIRG